MFDLNKFEIIYKINFDFNFDFNFNKVLYISVDKILVYQNDGLLYKINFDFNFNKVLYISLDKILEYQNDGLLSVWNLITGEKEIILNTKVMDVKWELLPDKQLALYITDSRKHNLKI